jgi:hypothetical protein
LPLFNDKSQLQDCFSALFVALRDDPDIGQRVQASGLVIRFGYSKPDTSVTLDCRRAPVAIEWDVDPVVSAEERAKICVDMTMDSDTAHNFWLGKVNLVAAITRGMIKAKGPIPSIMRLLPIIKPAFEVYPRILRQKGLANLIS